MTITTVSSLSALATAVSDASTDDIVQLSPGTYNNTGSLNLTTSATRVKVRSQIPHQARITGTNIDLGSAGIHFMNFDLNFSASSGNYTSIDGDGCRFSHNDVHFTDNSGTQHWVIVLGNSCIIDHNLFRDKTVDGNMLLIGSGGNVVTDTKIFGNEFKNMTGSAGETLRLGASNTAQVDFRSEVSYNRFKNCKADIETISVKASNNNLHHNYMEDCYSMSQRHGHNNKFNDNTLVRAGLRLSGYGHEVKRNQIIEDPNPNGYRGHLTIVNGDAEDDPGTLGQTSASHATYARCKNCTIDNNIIAGANATTGTIFYLGWDSAKLFPPIDNLIRDNIITASTGTLGTENSSGAGTTHYNVATGGDSSANLNSGSSIRYGIEAQAGSALIGDSIKTFKPFLRQSGSPSGEVTATVRRASDDAIVAQFDSVDSTTLETTFSEVTFTLDSAYEIASGDKILVEYSGPSTITIEAWTTNPFDSTLTRRTRYQSGVYATSNTTDIAGTLASEGGGALWSNQTTSGNIYKVTGTAIAGTIPATNTDPLLTQNADKTYEFTISSPLTWTKSNRVISSLECGIIRSFV